MSTPNKEEKIKVLGVEITPMDGDIEGTYTAGSSPLPEQEWEADFSLRFENNWKKDVEFWEKDIKDFIRTILASQKAALIQVIEGMKRIEDKWEEDNSEHYNEALDDLLSKLKHHE